MKHKHAEVIIAWANGAQIESKHLASSYWHTYTVGDTPLWEDDHEYRIKVQPVVTTELLYRMNPINSFSAVGYLTMTKNGATGETENVEFQLKRLVV